MNNLNDGEKNEKSHLVPLYEFAIHMVVGGLIFAGIALAAVGLDLFLKALPLNRGLIREILSYVKHLIFVIDIILFLIFLWVSFFRTARKLWSH